MPRRRLIVALIAFAGLSACSSSGTTSIPPANAPANSQSAAQSATRAGAASELAPGHAHQVCPGPANPGTARCHAWLRDDLPENATAHPLTVSGYHPVDLQSAYQIPSISTSPTVAIVDAYDDPYAENDLGVYRSQFGLQPCTTANGCFRKVNQKGGTSYPRANGGWSQEISLDLDMVSAICPNCKILLVEASSSSQANLGTAVNTAAALGAVAISNSYGASESSQTVAYDSYYNHPGIAVTVSSGDSGYGAQSPATAIYVTAVGGTSLKNTSGAWSQTVWSGAGSGCSAYNAQPSWQSTTMTGCARRAEADVSAVADPNTGVAVYDSYRYQGVSGWLVFGGTSVASPIIASVYAVAGNTASINYGSHPYAYVGTSSLYDITSGSNGSCGAPLCSAVTGWDGPTGVGAPSGAAAF